VSREVTGENNPNFRHGLSRHPLHIRWRTIKDRCCNPKNYSYQRYGGRGITICEEWKNSFMAFYEWSMANGFEQGLTIDRIDNNKGYSPDNCRWVDMKVQSNNTRRNNYLTARGRTQTLQQWCNELGFKSHQVVYGRLQRGWSVEDALFTPVKERRQNGTNSNHGNIQHTSIERKAYVGSSE